YRQSPAAPPTEELRSLDRMREASRQSALQVLAAAQANSRAEVFGEMRRYLEEHARLREEIREIHRRFLSEGPPPKSHSRTTDDKEAKETIEDSNAENSSEVFRRARSVYGDFLRWPQTIAYGNPFARREVLTDIKEQLLARLRPVRSATTGYSLIPGSRHGILPLNPVMKLWKEKAGYERQLPDVANKEINLRQTVLCLLDLARLVHPEMDSMELRLGRIVQEKLGIRNLKNMHFFLMPGSCGVVREIERPDFPDFRNMIIGESRKPQELGITEPSILTGAWYKKRNHSLYYPVGGDNGQLLRSIYLALRLPGPAAFYFALGQFVHDCLDDSLIYYVGSEIPFRQVMEDYYTQEDRVRKNRGEKTGRRKIDNSRDAVRFMFAVAYSRFLMEALTGSSQTHFRHPPTERWMLRYLNLPVLSLTDRSRFRDIRRKARSIIEDWGDAMPSASAET
ncbi:MAG: hypothetical protein KDK37_12475, partial [Leptospiraceae bacterium]|nr:hypothetical protein [Leptospiraceae bacterium]